MPYKDPEQFRAYQRAYQEAHRREHAARQRAYRQRQDAKETAGCSPEEAARIRQARAAEFGEYLRGRRQNNPTKYAKTSAAGSRRYRQRHPEKLQAAKGRRRQRISVAMTAEERAESAEWRKLIKDDPCFYCGALETHHVDHYISLANGGTDHWWNLVRACSPCNLRKGRMNGDDFLRLLGKNGDAPAA